jgi:uncharacterized repeat protein (TIGR03803 family)
MKKYSFLFFILFHLGIGTGMAQYSDLHNFNDTLGKYPYSSVTLVSNSLFGVTVIGGAYNYGCIFKMDTNGTGYRELVDFNDTNGTWPHGSLTWAYNKLYGMTQEGGNSYGNIFCLDTDGSNYRVLLQFNGPNTPLGEWPMGGITVGGGKLYGMTELGGIHGDGNIFSVDTDGTGFKDMFDFNSTDGLNPYGSLTLLRNKLYGMTPAGGANNVGCIFSIDTGGGGYTILYDFGGTNGASPLGSLLLSENHFYGMTQGGGANDSGAVFSIDTNGTNYAILHSFNGINGQYPAGSLIITGGVLYGMARSGGANGDGEIFSIDTNGGGFSDLIDFNGTAFPQGANPRGDLTCLGTELFGMTNYGGTYNDGIIFGFPINNLTTSTNQQKLNRGMQLSVYPNPNNGIFKITLSHAELVSVSKTIEVYNVLGQRIFGTLKQVQGDYEINIGNQPSGIYLYRVITENGGLVGEGKVVIQK